MKSVKLWWPVGYGSQPLYYLKLQWRSSSFTKQIGFRTVQVGQLVAFIPCLPL